MANDIKVFTHWYLPCDCVGYEAVRSMMTMPAIAFMNGENVTLQIQLDNDSTYMIDRVDIELDEITIRHAEGRSQSGSTVKWKRSNPVVVLPITIG